MLTKKEIQIIGKILNKKTIATHKNVFNEYYFIFVLYEDENMEI